MSVVKFNKVGCNDKFAARQFVKLQRMNSKTDEKWEEIINLADIAAIIEHRIGKQTYGDDPGRRRGYDVFTTGGLPGHVIWISDKEFNEIQMALGFVDD